MQKEPHPYTPFHIMAKPSGARCNLGCAYCFYLPKNQLYPGSALCMDDKTLEAYVRQIIDQPAPEVTFAWQGGEPTLLGLDFYARAVELQKKYHRPGQQILNTFQTNAILIDDAWSRFFAENHFLLGVSLDGPAELHDLYRRDLGGHPTHARVMAGIQHLKARGVEFNILACVNAATARHPLEVYHFLRDEVGATFIQWIPIVEALPGGGPALTSERSVPGAAYGQFLIQIFDEWVRRDVGTTFIQLFDACLAVWAGQRAGLCIFEPTCGKALALEHNGDLYSCDHYVDSAHLLGNICQTPLGKLARQRKQEAFGEAKRARLPRMCRECRVRFICNGECPKNRLGLTPDGEPGLNVLCAGLKAFFHHIDPYMKTMAALLAQRRPPAEIKALLAAREQAAPKSRRH